jgi:hypothetical protein
MLLQYSTPGRSILGRSILGRSTPGRGTTLKATKNAAFVSNAVKAAKEFGLASDGRGSKSAKRRGCKSFHSFTSGSVEPNYTDI